MNSTEIKVTHNGTEVTYNEKRNEWLFTLRGRDRSAPSLDKAKEFIDRVPKDKKHFERIKCWIKRSWGWDNDGEKWKQVEVTSISEDSLCVWVTDNKNRSKERIDCLFPCNPKNDALIAQWKVLDGQLEVLKEQQQSLQKKLKYLDVGQEEE